MITSGGVSVGEADFTKQLMDTLGDVAVLEDRDAPGPPLAFGRYGPASVGRGHRAVLRPAGQSGRR